MTNALTFLYSPSQVNYRAGDGVVWVYLSANHVASSLFRLGVSPPPAVLPVAAPPPAERPPVRLDDSLPSGWSWTPTPQVHTVTAALTTPVSVSPPAPVAYPYVELALALGEAVLVRLLLRGWRWLQGRSP